MSADALPRGVRILSLLAAIVVATQIGRMSVYMLDAESTGWSVMPWNAFGTGHSCVTGYWAAAEAIDVTPNVWSDDLASLPAAAPGTRVAKRIGPFAVDTYEYTPTFLLVPRALRHVTPDFAAFRVLWYVLNVVVVGAGLVAVARRLMPAGGPAVLWLTPLVLVPLSVLVTFQIGNVQLACVAGVVLPMLWFERAAEGRRPWLYRGAAALLLAYLTVSKLYPGMLVLYLMLRGDRAAAWSTFGLALALGLIGVADVGVAPHRAFLDHLPKLLSGESFPNLRVPGGIAANMSVPGLARKLSLYGLPFSGFDAMRVVGWLYTGVVLAVVARLARRPLPRPLEPIAWIAILLLATLRSPVLPVYGIFPAVWLLSIVLALRWRETRLRIVLLAWFLPLAVVTPSWTLWLPRVHPIVTAIVLTAGSVALTILAIRSARSTADSPAS